MSETTHSETEDAVTTGEEEDAAQAAAEEIVEEIVEEAVLEAIEEAVVEEIAEEIAEEIEAEGVAEVAAEIAAEPDLVLDATDGQDTAAGDEEDGELGGWVKDDEDEEPLPAERPEARPGR